MRIGHGFCRQIIRILPHCLLCIHVCLLCLLFMCALLLLVIDYGQDYRLSSFRSNMKPTAIVSRIFLWIHLSSSYWDHYPSSAVFLSYIMLYLFDIENCIPLCHSVVEYCISLCHHVVFVWHWTLYFSSSSCCICLTLNIPGISVPICWLFLFLLSSFVCRSRRTGEVANMPSLKSLFPFIKKDPRSLV